MRTVIPLVFGYTMVCLFGLSMAASGPHWSQHIYWWEYLVMTGFFFAGAALGLVVTEKI